MINVANKKTIKSTFLLKNYLSQINKYTPYDSTDNLFEDTSKYNSSFPDLVILLCLASQSFHTTTHKSGEKLETVARTAGRTCSHGGNIRSQRQLRQPRQVRPVTVLKQSMLLPYSLVSLRQCTFPMHLPSLFAVAVDISRLDLLEAA